LSAGVAGELSGNQAWELLKASLLARLQEQIAGVWALELNIARMRGEPGARGLGEEPRDSQGAPAGPCLRRSLGREYPLLESGLRTITDTWIDANLRFLRHLAEDGQAMADRFGDGQPLGAPAVVEPVGDPHAGSRVVLSVRFSSGLRLAYKPHSVDTELAVQELLAWLNAAGAEPALPTLRVLASEDHGWTEWVPDRACAEVGQVRRCYRRLGQWLGVLYALRAMDAHRANIVVQDEHPHVVDLETVLHPCAHLPDAEPGERALHRELTESVLGTGMLPHHRLYEREDREGVDVSGLGGAPGQRLPPGEEWVEVDGDSPRRIMRAGRTGDARNRPVLGDQAADVRDYVDDLVEGFRGLYDLLLRERSALLAADSPLRGFEQAERRVVLRASAEYEALRRACLHPDHLRSEQGRERLFAGLHRATSKRPYLAPAIPAESEALRRGDIPRFVTFQGSDRIWSADGVSVAGVIAAAPSAQDALRELSRSDLERSTWMIRAAVATLGRPTPGAPPPPAASRIASSDQLMDAARRIGEMLSGLAIRTADSAYWIGLVPQRHGAWRIRALGPGLAHGAAGVAVFLARLGALSEDEATSELALATLVPVRELLAGELPPDTDQLEGLPEALLAVGHAADSEELCVEARALRARLPSFKPGNRIDPELIDCLRADEPRGRTLLIAAAQSLAGSHPGALAGADLMLWGAHELLDGELEARAAALASAVLEQGQRSGWRCATPDAVSTPGLAAGLSGIGHGLLRFADPARVPSLIELGGSGRTGTASPEEGPGEPGRLDRAEHPRGVLVR